MRRKLFLLVSLILLILTIIPASVSVFPKVHQLSNSLSIKSKAFNLDSIEFQSNSAGKLFFTVNGPNQTCNVNYIDFNLENIQIATDLSQCLISYIENDIVILGDVYTYTNPSERVTEISFIKIRNGNKEALNQQITEENPDENIEVKHHSDLGLYANQKFHYLVEEINYNTNLTKYFQYSLNFNNQNIETRQIGSIDFDTFIESYYSKFLSSRIVSFYYELNDTIIQQNIGFEQNNLAISNMTTDQSTVQCVISRLCHYNGILDISAHHIKKSNENNEITIEQLENQENEKLVTSFHDENHLQTGQFLSNNLYMFFMKEDPDNFQFSQSSTHYLLNYDEEISLNSINVNPMDFPDYQLSIVQENEDTIFVINQLRSTESSPKFVITRINPIIISINEFIKQNGLLISGVSVLMIIVVLYFNHNRGNDKSQLYPSNSNNN